MYFNGSLLRIIALIGLSLAQLSAAERLVDSPPEIPKVAPASSLAELAMKQLVVPPGFRVELFAAEPAVANPVAFYIDNQGRFYVCETFRHTDGVLDIRGIMDWLGEELASRSIDDRLFYTKRHLGSQLEKMTRQTERIRRLVDRDGDGRADEATVFADGFNGILDGIGAGVIVRGTDIWYANIPNLWLLRDREGKGIADFRKPLQRGYGVRVGFLGHDLHGLRFGPDGKLYFSIGDRGSRVETEHGIVGDTESGSVFRCNPDGSELELFATGLRNPQDLIFDDFGNLFTGDNNSDSGDKARWVYVVEGGDNGWRVGYQFMESPYSRGAFNDEKLWYPYFQGQAAYIVPPIANIASGPSGVAYDPGTGMPEKYRRHFFLTDFRGGRGSVIHSFALQPKGAYFDLVDREIFLDGGLPTDVDFGIEAGIYYSDWVQGWSKPGKGRIYHIFDPAVARQPIVAETKRLLMQGMAYRTDRDLARLLEHPNFRVRQEAQFELASRGRKSIQTLARVAESSRSGIARLHGIWGLGQIAAQEKNGVAQVRVGPPPEALQRVFSLLDDKDPEVRAQAAKVVGDARMAGATKKLARLLDDESPRVQFFAALGVGKLGQRQAVGPVMEFLRKNADRDPYLRHAGVMALTWINEMEALKVAVRDHSSSVRMGALLAMRRLGRPEIDAFLHDSDPWLVLEAVRAIHDVPIKGAFPELAALLDQPQLSEPALRRIIDANLRTGLPWNAAQLAQFAARASAPEKMRAQSLQALAMWVAPSGRDPVNGLWRPVAERRTPEPAREALQPLAENLFNDALPEVAAAAAEAAGKLQLKSAGPALLDLLAREKPAPVQAAALRALAALNDERLAQALDLAEKSSQESVRQLGLRLRAQVKPMGATGRLAAALENGTIGEKQNALAALGDSKDPGAEAILSDWFDRLLSRSVPKEIRLDIVEAAAKHPVAAIKEKLARYENSFSKEGPLAGYGDLLYGGNPAEGKKVFLERPEAACVRCHKIHGEGGEVGPELSAIGARQPREYILESVIYPNRKIAAGFESLIVTLKDGTAYAGVLKSETDQELVLNSPEDGLVTVKKSQIKTRDRGLSPMPEGLTNALSKEDLRNLVEFLAEQKQ